MKSVEKEAKRNGQKTKGKGKPLFAPSLFFLCLILVLLSAVTSSAQKPNAPKQNIFEEDEEFGPIVRSYLAHLEDEQDVTDDRASRHEINPAYYRRNSNRILALRQTVIRLARESGNDFVPELEAVAFDELKTIFETLPDVKKINVGDILNNTFRYLGTVRVGVVFYIFERLDPYEQADLIKKQKEETRPRTTEKKTEASGAATAKEKTQAPKKPESPR